MEKRALPTIRVKNTHVVEARRLAMALAVAAMPFGMDRRNLLWSEPILAWTLVAAVGLVALLMGLRILVPSTLTLDASSVTWKTTLGPTRRYSWVDIEKFGVVPPRPPLIDPLIGITFRPGRALGPLIRAKWTGYDTTLGSGWKPGPQALVETLDKYLKAARTGRAEA